MKQIEKIRHSLAHLLAMAVLEKFPDAKLGIGPPIENGFYYDFKLPRPLKPEDLPELQKRMRELARSDLPFSGKKVTSAEARKIFKNQPFKLDLIKQFVKEKKPLTIYTTGDSNPHSSASHHPHSSEFFIDLCRGGHVKSTREIPADAFHLDKIAGAYWRGDERNPMLTRIYGLAFETKKELATYLKMREEAEKRDHRKLGADLEIFMIDERIGKGLPVWLPNGTIIRNEIEKLAIEMENKYGYERIVTPHIAKEDLFKLSGHLPYYADSMYPPMTLDDGTYYLKAMNCPLTHLVYLHRPRSYRDLPIRLAEYGTVYRNELSGTLAGLLRVRMLSMNDAHIYCAREHIEQEFKNALQLTREYFEIFGLSKYWFRLSKWNPKNKKKYINEPTNWKYSESVLRKVLKNAGVPFVEAPDEAAFYGPKIDVQFKSVIGREETMSTIQLDFVAKKRFNLSYTDTFGKKNNDVFVIHRAPLSTHERFMAFLLEHYAGAFPLWLSPVQVALLAVSDRQQAYAEKVCAELKENNIRAELKETNETLGKRIRKAELQKIPYLAVLGKREEKTASVTVRKRGVTEQRTIPVQQFIAELLEEIKNRSR